MSDKEIRNKMICQTIQEKLDIVRDMLRTDNKWEKSFNIPKTSSEICNWLKENKPEVVKILNSIDFEEAKEHGFTVAIIAFGQLMK